MHQNTRSYNPHNATGVLEFSAQSKCLKTVKCPFNYKMTDELINSENNSYCPLFQMEPLLFYDVSLCFVPI